MCIYLATFKIMLKSALGQKKTIQIGAAIKSYTANKMTENKIE